MDNSKLIFVFKLLVSLALLIAAGAQAISAAPGALATGMYVQVALPMYCAVAVWIPALWPYSAEPAQSHSSAKPRRSKARA